MPLTTRDTVARLMPATLATSFIVGRRRARAINGLLSDTVEAAGCGALTPAPEASARRGRSSLASSASERLRSSPAFPRRDSAAGTPRLPQLTHGCNRSCREGASSLAGPGGTGLSREGQLLNTQH